MWLWAAHTPSAALPKLMASCCLPMVSPWSRSVQGQDLDTQWRDCSDNKLPLVWIIISLSLPTSSLSPSLPSCTAYVVVSKCEAINGLKSYTPSNGGLFFSAAISEPNLHSEHTEEYYLLHGGGWGHPYRSFYQRTKSHQNGNQPVRRHFL